MSKSQRLRFRDLRDIYRLIGDCRDLGANVRSWREHMLQGLRRLVDAQVAVGSEVRTGGPERRIEVRHCIDLGWASAASRAYFLRYLDGGGVVGDPTLWTCLNLAHPLATRRREQLIGDRPWFNSVEYNEFRRPAGSDDWLGSIASPAEFPAFQVINLDRPPGAKRFTPRETRLVHLFHHELKRLIPVFLAWDEDGYLAGLSLRLRQTLGCLLEGDSEKQVALRLGLSRHTVHEYVKTLYRRFDVSSRAELLAYCLRIRPPGRGVPPSL